LKKRNSLIKAANSMEMTDQVRDDLAAEIWELAKELDVRTADVGTVISLYLQSKSVNAALDVVEEVHRDEVKLAPEVARIVQQLVDRCREIAKEQADEVQAARVERVPPIVGPDGKPIST
jgi:hypothetical protein